MGALLSLGVKEVIVFTDENSKDAEREVLELSFLGNPDNQREPLMTRDNPNIVGHNPTFLHQFTRLAPQPQYATLVRVDIETEYYQPEAPVFRPSQKEIDDLTPSSQSSLVDRLAAITEVYGGKAIPISASEEELKFSPVTPWESDELEDEEISNRETFSHKGPSLQEDLKKEMLYNAEILISFNSLYREAHADYILAREQYNNSKTNNDYMKLQRKETEINLMSKPIFMAEKMQKLLAETLSTLERYGLDRGVDLNNNNGSNNNNFRNKA